MLTRFITLLVSACGLLTVKAQEKNTSAIPDPEYMNQVYYIGDSNKLVTLQKEKASMKTKTKLGGFGGSSMSYVMEGSSSAIHFGNSKPSFAVKMDGMMMDPSSALKLYKFNKNKNDRESIISKSGIGGKNSSTNMDGISFTVKKTSTGVYILSPEEPLEPGEYGILNLRMPAGSGMTMAYTTYTFAIN